MKIAVFEVEAWEQETFDSLKDDHEIEFFEEAIQRILDTTVVNISAYAKGQIQNVVS
jgi:hypothetical protein